MRKLFIWGAGDIGRRVLAHLDEKWDIVFVDNNKEKVNKIYRGKKVIGIDEYLDKYADRFILIAHLQEAESIAILQKRGVFNYFVHCELPGEFQKPVVMDTLKEYVIKRLGDRTDYVLYGLGLYSVIVDGWLYDRFGIHPYILKQEDMSQSLTDRIIQQYDGLRVINSIQDMDGIKAVYVCLDNYCEVCSDPIFHGYDIIDLFDCTESITAYHNPKIECFYNIYKGKRCFIVATGPSLKMKDLDILKENEEVCISMNTIFYAFDKTAWKPDYYVASDYRMFDQYKDILDDLPIKTKFLSDDSEEFWSMPHRENVFCYHQHYEYCFDRLPKFSKNFSIASYMGLTVTYVCIQLAAYMGFSEIYLLGVDFSYGGQDKNINYTHFYGKNTEKTEPIGYVKQVSLAYQAAKKYADTHGIKIYNATRGGKLEIFERVDFDTLF